MDGDRHDAGAGTRRSGGYRFAVLTLALTTFAFIGCGRTEHSSDDSAMEEPAIVADVSSIEKLCVEFPAALGAYMARCYGGDPEAWRASFEAPCGPAIRSVAAGRSALDVGNAVACLTSLQGDDCTSFDAWRTAGGPCRGLLVGSVPTGEPCNPLALWGQNECEPAAYCDRHGPGCEASCRAYGVVGQSCAGNYNTTVCLAGLACDYSLGCQVAALEGQECGEETFNCADGLYCDTASGGPATCRRGKTEGPCQTITECAPTHRCIEESCVPALAVGEACNYGSNECAGRCSFEGRCQVAAQQGDRCGRGGGGVACGAGLFCGREEETCRPSLELGAPCTGVYSAGQPCANVGNDPGYCDRDADMCVICEGLE